MNTLAMWIGYAVMIPVGFMLLVGMFNSLMDSFNPPPPAVRDSGNNLSWGFKRSDFIYFSDRISRKGWPEAHLMVLGGLGGGDIFNAQMVGTKKQLDAMRKKRGYSGGDYNAGQMEGATLATKKDDKKIQRFLKDNYSKEFGDMIWAEWQKRDKNEPTG